MSNKRLAIWDLFCVAFLAAMMPCASALGQVESPKQASSSSKRERFVFVLTLDDSQIKALRIDGFLKSRVPKKLLGKIAAIKIQRGAHFLDEVRTVKANASRNGGALAMVVDESVIDRLEYQPVQMKVYNSEFTSLLIRHDWNRKMVPGTPGIEIEPTAKDSKALFVRIQPNRQVLGHIKDAKKIAVATDFGKVKIDSNDILGIKFNVGLEKKEIVSLASGDTFSAQIETKTITLKTRWGARSLNVSELDSVTAAVNLVFVQDKESPSQWKVQIKPPGAQAPGLPGN